MQLAEAEQREEHLRRVLERTTDQQELRQLRAEHERVKQRVDALLLQQAEERRRFRAGLTSYVGTPATGANIVPLGRANNRTPPPYVRPTKKQPPPAQPSVRALAAAARSANGGSGEPYTAPQLEWPKKAADYTLWSHKPLYLPTIYGTFRPKEAHDPEPPAGAQGFHFGGAVQHLVPERKSASGLRPQRHQLQRRTATR